MNGAELQGIRRSLKLTQIEFAYILNVSQAYISSVEQGKNVVTDKILNNLKQYIDENNLPINIVEEPPDDYFSVEEKKTEYQEIYEFIQSDRQYRIPEMNAIGGYAPGSVLALQKVDIQYAPIGVLYLIVTRTDNLELLRYIIGRDDNAGVVTIAQTLEGLFAQTYPIKEIAHLYIIKSFFTKKM